MGQTQLSIKVRRMLPFLKQREILVTPEQLSFSRQLVVPHEHLTEEGRIAAQKRWESQRVVSETPFYKAPLKKINLGLWMFFMNTRRLFTQEHFVYTKIAGKKSDFRMDTMGTLSPELFLLEKGTRQGIL
ncbi:hypothetical protein LOZ53_002614 [Ophidiomyces ophidiicola]|uniref:uncharacterized protein n=1 Tax=Ophidiomyces ophidiicola TaxID=1387563 RepID=UPI0020C20592|nr:uncharacterized protein LOZ57_003913 [Ophidiomyces ophidiicola]KAI1913141.1 hypothetical protein LOZ61_002908 [Ophidiomyces ophidiicola]KAI1920700.1 hypothetical protein LOZ64_001748 [Ophidiomyces ophidiicola]KAI1928553.1 hypothetical protein LOZ60_002274 [Ophidiomyces ophidiicola]KAI1946161.1 hypothetical protein LOZ57_003913 [Ophidiomyces ophidiicola]KAI1978417.1 hypothetical protein LOZ55_002746 [Ophidiomyces ophidiicola]